MSIEPFFSIIIPTYNRAHTIRKAIDSIINQSYGDWELIIVDDGSTDNTKSVVDSYSDSRIKYVWQENQERSAARNHGIIIATGKWSCFQDSDDEYLPDHLQVLFEGICQFPEYMVFRTGMYIFKNGVLAKTPKFDVKNEYELYPFDAFTTFAFKSGILKEIKFKKELINSQDFHLLLRINALYQIKILKNYTNIYHYDPENGAGLGRTYYKIYRSKILCFEDLLAKKINIKDKYIKRKLCISNIIMLDGHLKYNHALIVSSIKDNLSCLARYPVEYTKLILRIIYVKFMEIVFKKSFDYRF